MAIRGSLSEANLADVLQLLALGQKTGILSLAREGSFGTIHFSRGAIWHAALVNRKERLGERLVRAALLTRDELDALCASSEVTDDPTLAAALQSTATVAPEALAREYRALVEEIVCDLFTWNAGTFAFEPQSTTGVTPLLQLSADSLLMEAARRVDEWTQIAKLISSTDLLFELDVARLTQSGVTLTSEQAVVAPLLDGSCDIVAIAERAGLSEFAVGQAVYALALAGFAQKMGRSSQRRAPAPESRVAEHRNLGVAFYRTRMFEEAVREFRRVLDLRDTDADARFYLGLVAVRRGDWPEAIDLLRRAASEANAPVGALHALAYAYERSGKMALAGTTLAEVARRGAADDPRVALSQAVVSLRSGDIERAQERLTTARALWGARQPTAVWFHYAALAAGLMGDSERALLLLEEGITLHPHATVLYNNLAVLQERRGLHEAAARTLEHALLEESGVPHLHKNLGDYHYRQQRYDEALESYERVTRLAPSHGADVWLRIGNIQYRLGDQVAGRGAWERAQALDPENAIVRANLGVVRNEPSSALLAHAEPAKQVA